MNVEQKKQELLVVLEQVEEECRILLERIPAYKEDLQKVKTIEDALLFDQTHDIESGLKYIEVL